jgi:hypothetical protein
VETPPFFSLFFFVFKRIPLVESDPNFMGGDRSEFRPIVSENINFLREGERKRERERDFMGGKSSACIKLLVRASKVRESFPKDNRKLLLKGGPGSRMKQRETTTEEEK